MNKIKQVFAISKVLPQWSDKITKTLRIMKITAFLLIIICLHASAGGHSQTITISVKNASLEKVFKEVKKQTDYEFVYRRELLESARKVNLNVTNASLRQVLDICFKEQPFIYNIIDKLIVLSERPEQKSISPPPTLQIDIKGKVTNEKGEPVAGATVTIKGTTKATATNDKGDFFLEGVNEKTTLVVTFVGYETQAIAVNGRTKLTIVLQLHITQLDETVVIAYGTTTKRLITGNVSTVKATDIEKQPVSNPLLALQGRVPGLFVTQNTGIAGGGITVRIQGQNSLQNGNDPLYVIDGVPFPSQLPRTGIDYVLGNSGDGIGSGNPLSYINPADIESIEVLKDADATSIYGSRAANGAILITTKKGKAGKTKLDLNMQTGWGEVSRKLNMLNTRQYLDMRYEALKNDGITTIPSSANDLRLWDTTRYTDWQETLIGGTANYTNINATVSGGTPTVQYLISGTYHRETTVFPYPKNDFAAEKGSLRFSLNTLSVDKRFKMQFSGNYLVDDNRLPQFDITETAVLLEPNAPALFNPDGSINWAPNAAGTSTFTVNPMTNLYTRYRNSTNNLIGNLVAGYKILPGLEISNSLGYTRTETDDYIPYPTLSIRPEERAFTPRAAVYGDRNLNSWITEPQLTYKTNIGKGKLDVLAGATILQTKSKTGYLIGSGHLNDQMLENIYAATTVSVGFSVLNSEYKYNAVFGRLTYNWADKYILNLTARRDGSSRFGGANRFNNFGSAGAAWLFSNEDFIKKNLAFLSFGKLRGSYGTTGSDQIGDYNFMSLYSIFNTPLPYQGINSLIPAGLPNPHLQWEETRKLQMGIDLGFLADRILVNLTYARNRSSNQLLFYALPLMTGFGNQQVNFPALVQNTSWELALNTVNTKTKNFTWTSGINLTIPRNKLVDFPNLSTSTLANSLVIGKPVSIEKYYHLLGVDPATGNYMYESKADAFKPTAPDDNTVIINTNPKYYGGFQNNISFKGLELDFLFQFVEQIGQNFIFWNGNRDPGRFARGFSNQPITVLDRWQKPGDNATIRKFSTRSHPYSRASDYNISDASYIRLKNLSLSWQIPNNWVSKVHLQNCRIYLQGQNLLTITKYKGLDPETRNITSLPPLRVLTVGIQAGL